MSDVAHPSFDQGDFRGKRKTCKRYDIIGNAHALTFSCFERRPFLCADRSRAWFIESLDDARRSLAFDVWGYVLMPEHVHLVIYPTKDDYSISNILLAIKRPVARKALDWVRHNAPAVLEQMRDLQPNGRIHHRFWQRGGGYDRNLICDATIYRTLDYIHANPVRRGLVVSPHDWRWSNAAHYCGASADFVPDTKHLPPRNYSVR